MITAFIHHHTTMITVVIHRAINLITIVPPHHSIAFLHPHPISRIVIAVMSPWTQVIILLSRDVHYHLVLIVIIVITGQSLAIVTIVARQVTSSVTAQPTNHSKTSSVPMLLWKNHHHLPLLMTVS